MARIENKDLFAGDAISKTTDDINVLIKAVKNLDTVLVKVAKDQKKVLNQQDNKTVESINRTNKATDTLNKTQKKTVEVRREQVKLVNLVNNSLKLEADTIERLQANVDRLTKRRRALNLEEKKGIITAKNANKERVRINILLKANRRNLNAATKAVIDNSREVTKSTSAFSRLGASMKRVAGIALAGLGIRAIGRAFRDTFERIREFDKELQNLSGISGISRKDLAGIEREIIKVAGASIKTSNEVAKLATVLFALGKTEKEVKLLLKPVNDLAIALGATSEETADFLGQTLNAFGKGAESAQSFADIIANVRTSTSLDFERIKDALGFVAPTARALNLTLGETSALIGVLQDNGIKAARAGRLLSTSFLKLAKEGRSLDSALDKINEAQERGADSLEVLRIAGDLFGKQSAALGLVLANNRERVAELADSFDNLSGGSLKRLTDEQLKSMDAQFKILDSTWEKFILGIDSGDGVISRTIRGAIKLVNGLINSLIRLNETFAAEQTRESGAEADRRAKEIERRVETQREGLAIIIKKIDASEKFTEDQKAALRIKKTEQTEARIVEIREGHANFINKRLQELEKIHGDRLGDISGEIEKRSLSAAQRAARDLIALTNDNLKARFLAEDAANRAITDDLFEILVLRAEANALLETEVELIDDVAAASETASSAIVSSVNEQTKASDKRNVSWERFGQILDRIFQGLKTLEPKTLELITDVEDVAFDFTTADKLTEENDEIEKALEERRQLAIDSANAIAEALSQIIDDSFARTFESIDKQLLATQNRISELQAKAAESELDASESIALERQKEAELERQRQLEQRKQLAQQALITILNSFNANVAAGVENPLAKTFLDATALRALASTLTAFDGVEDTGGRGDSDSKGGKQWTLHPNERVLNKKQNDPLLKVGISNEELSHAGQLYASGAFTDTGNMFNRQSLMLNGMMSTKKLEDKMDSLENAIKANAPIKSSMEIDNVRRILIAKTKQGNKVTREISKLHS